MPDEKTRAVICKIGIDDHYRGIQAVSEALRDAGMEVIYLGLSQKVDKVIATVIHEDADVLGLGFLCGGHLQIMQDVMNKLREKGLERVVVIAGGTISGQDIIKLKAMGISAVFPPGSSLTEITNHIKAAIQKQRAAC